MGEGLKGLRILNTDFFFKQNKMGGGGGGGEMTERRTKDNIVK